MISVLLIVCIVLSLALVAFCAGSETAYLSLNRGRVEHLARMGSRAALTVNRALNELPATTTALLIGNNLSAVIYSSSSAALAARVFPASAMAEAVWGFVAAMVVLYIGEFLPKLFCAARPLRRALSLASFYRVFRVVLSPFTALALAVTSLFIHRDERRYKVTTSDLLRILEDRKDGVKLTSFESALISRILVLRRKGEKVTKESLLSALDE